MNTTDKQVRMEATQELNQYLALVERFNQGSNNKIRVKGMHVGSHASGSDYHQHNTIHSHQKDHDKDRQVNITFEDINNSKFEPM